MVCARAMMENETGFSPQNINGDRPDRIPCPECGRIFTKGGYDYHRSTCTERDDCQCAVCKMSKQSCISINFVIQQTQLGDANETPVNLNCEESNLNSLPEEFNTPNISHNVYDFHEDEESLNSSGFMRETSKKIALSEATDAYMQDDEDTNATILYDRSDACNSTSTECLDEDSLLNVENDKPKENQQIVAEITEYIKDHHGLPCSRKLFCKFCQEHVIWESFGAHILQHCVELESGYIKCPVCIKNFSRPTMLLLHYFIHLGEHPVGCPDCRCRYDLCIDATERFKNEHSYAENFKCYICLKTFSHEQSIANHMRLHSEEMPYTCKECNRSFRQVGNLQRHMTTHRGERPHQCPKCEKSFADPATLRNHVRVHTGETPYVCIMCKRGFSQVGNLKRHMALHLKNRPSSPSSSVEKKFDDGIILAANIMIEEDSNDKSLEDSMDVDASSNDNADETAPSVETQSETGSTASSKVPRGRKRNGQFRIFTCPDCQKIYTWKHDLQVHMRTHTGEKPYSCQVCHKRFAQSGAVKTHQARHHIPKPKKKPYMKKTSS